MAVPGHLVFSVQSKKKGKGGLQMDCSGIRKSRVSVCKKKRGGIKKGNTSLRYSNKTGPSSMFLRKCSVIARTLPPGKVREGAGVGGQQVGA